MLRKSALLFICAGFGLFATKANATVEQFSYGASGGDLTTIATGTWAAHSTGTNPQQYITTGLTYSGLTGETGGAVTFTTAGEDDSRAIGSMLGTGNNETAYVSAVISIASAQATGDYFFHLTDGTAGSNNFRGRLYAKSTSGGYFLGLAWGNGTVTYDTVVRTFGTTYFIVEKFTSISGASNDQVKLFVNPALDTAEPGATVSVTETETTQDWANFDFVAVRQGSASNAPAGTVDTIRTGTAWADVTGSDATVPVIMSGFAAE